MKTPSRHLPLFLVANGIGATFVVLGIFTWSAWADQDGRTDDVPLLVPYHGILEFDGEPVTLTGIDAPTMIFALHDGDADDATEVFAQTQQVSVYGGRFTALLGADNATCTPTPAEEGCLQAAIGASDDLYLRISVNGTPLGTPQRFVLTPHAVWATNAADFSTLSGATVRGNAEVGGTVRAANISYLFNVNQSAPGSTLVTGAGLSTTGALSVGGDAFLGNDASDVARINGDLIGPGVSVGNNATGDFVATGVTTVGTIDNLVSDLVRTRLHGNARLEANSFTPHNRQIQFTPSAGDANDYANIQYRLEDVADGNMALRFTVGDDADDVITVHAGGNGEQLRLRDTNGSSSGGVNATTDSAVHAGSSLSTAGTRISDNGLYCTSDNDCPGGLTCLANDCAVLVSGVDQGDWNAVQFCSEGRYICGIQLRTDPPSSGDNDVGIVDTALRCCLF